MNHGIFNREKREPHENKRREDTEVFQAQSVFPTNNKCLCNFRAFRVFRG
jgi:hypothetical protein